MKTLNLTIKFGLTVETTKGTRFSLVSSLFVPDNPGPGLWQRFKDMCRSLVYQLIPAPMCAG